MSIFVGWKNSLEFLWLGYNIIAFYYTVLNYLYSGEILDTLGDIFDFLMENAPVAAAVGGAAASTALVANPSLPMTGSNGVPPGIYTHFY